VKPSHTAATTSAAADDSNPIAYGGLSAGVRLAERCGLPGLVRDKVRLTGAANGAGRAPDAKVMSLVAGMLAGADSTDDVDVLRHGAMSPAFSGIRAPTTLGTFLRAFTWGHVRQLESAARMFTASLVRHCPLQGLRRGERDQEGDGMSDVVVVKVPKLGMSMQEGALPASVDATHEAGEVLAEITPN